jgi:hypothetical protein
VIIKILINPKKIRYIWDSKLQLYLKNNPHISESPAKSPFLQALFNVQHSKFNIFRMLDDNNFANNGAFDFLQ